MFTIYIHILEVLAMHPHGASSKIIADMGAGLLTERKAKSHLRDLEIQGFVTHNPDGTDWWHITEKAIEYCETVIRRYEDANPAMITPKRVVVSETYAQDDHGDSGSVNMSVTIQDENGDRVTISSVVEKGHEEAAKNAITDVLMTPPATNIPGGENDANLPDLGPKDEYSEEAIMEANDPVRVAEYRAGAYGSPDDWEFETCEDCGEMMRSCHCYDVCEDCGHLNKDCWC